MTLCLLFPPPRNRCSVDGTWVEWGKRGGGGGGGSVGGMMNKVVDEL